jgi:hypothetical protein
VYTYIDDLEHLFKRVLARLRGQKNAAPAPRPAVLHADLPSDA